MTVLDNNMLVKIGKLSQSSSYPRGCRCIFARSCSFFQPSIQRLQFSECAPQRYEEFGLSVVAQIQQNDFEEKHLLELQDSRLLELCLKLNIVDEEGFFFLDQCRNVRNNFSAAHPTWNRLLDLARERCRCQGEYERLPYC